MRACIDSDVLMGHLRGERKPLNLLKRLRDDRQIIDKAGEFYRKWRPRNGTAGNDAIPAATVLQTGGRIYTLNSKHYPMAEVAVQRAWKATGKK